MSTLKSSNRQVMIYKTTSDASKHALEATIAAYDFEGNVSGVGLIIRACLSPTGQEWNL